MKALFVLGISLGSAQIERLKKESRWVNAMRTNGAADTPQAELAAVLRDRFRQVEREILLRRLNINPEDVKLHPLTRDDFVWAMVSYTEQRARLGELWDAVEHERPGCLPRPNPFR